MGCRGLRLHPRICPMKLRSVVGRVLCLQHCPTKRQYWSRQSCHRVIPRSVYLRMRHNRVIPPQHLPVAFLHWYKGNRATRRFRLICPISPII